VRDSRPYQLFFSSKFSRVKRCATLAVLVLGSQTMLTGLFKDARFGPFFKSTHVNFTCGSLSLWTMLGMEILAHLFFFFFSRVFARLEMRHTRDFGVGILNYAYWTF